MPRPRVFVGPHLHFRDLGNQLQGLWEELPSNEHPGSGHTHLPVLGIECRHCSETSYDFLAWGMMLY